MHPCYTIGITGGSASGKTFFIKSLAARFKPEEVCVISQDHYYKPINLQQRDSGGIENFDLPAALEREKFHRDIIRLKNGEQLLIPEYTFNNPNAVPGMLEFRPAPILIVEGIFVQYFEEVASELDLKIFIEAKDYIKLTRRIMRDKDERGYDVHDVLYRFRNHVMPIYDALIKPLKQHADLIIPNNQDFEKALDVLTLALRAKLAKLLNES